MTISRGWQDEIIAKLESGVDVTQIDAQLRVTPTERLEGMRRFLEFLEGARRDDGDGPAKTA